MPDYVLSATTFKKNQKDNRRIVHMSESAYLGLKAKLEAMSAVVEAAREWRFQYTGLTDLRDRTNTLIRAVDAYDGLNVPDRDEIINVLLSIVNDLTPQKDDA